MARFDNGKREKEHDELTKQVEEKVRKMLPTEIEHHVKVHIIFDYVTTHPLSGEEVPVEVEPRRISAR